MIQLGRTTGHKRIPDRAINRTRVRFFEDVRAAAQVALLAEQWSGSIAKTSANILDPESRHLPHSPAGQLI